MTVNEIEGAALAYVMNPGAVTRLPLRRKAEESLAELVQDIREADTDIANNVDDIDLFAEQNTYAAPVADSIRKVERFDLAGVGQDDPAGYPCGLVPIDLLPRAHKPAYAIAPSGLVIWPTPVNNMESGLRVMSLPVAEKLPNDGQTPRVPEPLHSVLVAKLVRHLGELAGIQVSPKAEDYIAAKHRFMLGYLNPGGREAVTKFARSKAIYHPRRF